MEYLDAVVARVGDGKLAVPGHVDPLRRREVSGARAKRAELRFNDATDGTKLHYSMIARVGDYQAVVEVSALC